VLDKIFRFVVENLIHEVLIELGSNHLFELLPYLAREYKSLVETDELKAEVFELRAVVGMGKQKHSQHVSMCDKLVYVLAADLSKFWHHEIVSINQNLQEELDALLSDVEVPRVQILDDAVKDGFGYSFDLNQSEGIAP